MVIVHLVYAGFNEDAVLSRNIVTGNLNLRTLSDHSNLFVFTHHPWILPASESFRFSASMDHFSELRFRSMGIVTSLRMRNGVIPFWPLVTRVLNQGVLLLRQHWIRDVVGCDCDIHQVYTGRN